MYKYILVFAFILNGCLNSDNSKPSNKNKENNKTNEEKVAWDQITNQKLSDASADNNITAWFIPKKDPTANIAKNIVGIKYGNFDAKGNFDGQEKVNQIEPSKVSLIEVAFDKNNPTDYFYNNIDGKVFENILPAYNKLNYLILDNKHNYRASSTESPNSDVFAFALNLVSFISSSKGYGYKGFLQARFFNSGLKKSKESLAIILEDNKLYRGKFSLQIPKEGYDFEASFIFDEMIEARESVNFESGSKPSHPELQIVKFNFVYKDKYLGEPKLALDELGTMVAYGKLDSSGSQLDVSSKKSIIKGSLNPTEEVDALNYDFSPVFSYIANGNKAAKQIAGRFSLDLAQKQQPYTGSTEKDIYFEAITILFVSNEVVAP